MESDDVDPRPLHVLVVDDHRDTVASLVLLLDLWGHESSVAHDGAAAVKAALACPPDVVLLDIGLPKLDGCEVAKCLRREPTTAGALLLAMTGHTQDSDRRRCQEAGIDHFLVKPVDPEELERLLRRGAAR
jgi:CheY-like chemotaxis protein